MNELLNRFYRYEFVAALTCILMPFILIFANGSGLHSISEYAYTDIDFIYVFLLTVASTLITVVGVIKNQILTWILGLVLMIVPLTPHLDFPTIHLVASIIFFAGIIIDILYYTEVFYKFRLFLVGAIALAFGIYYATDWISLFTAESVGLVVFGVNFLADLIGEKKEMRY